MTWTDNIESTEIWCRWAAISTIAAVLERKVWIETNSPLYPNLYVFLVGEPGTGKSLPINCAAGFMRTIENFFLGPTSMTMASLVDHMEESVRVIDKYPPPAIQYNTLTICPDELSAFIHKWDDELVAGLIKFYDCTWYGQGRRVGKIRKSIEKPQLNILSGATPSHLLKLIPEHAWEGGFTSRAILVHSAESERRYVEFGSKDAQPMPSDMLHDLELISKIEGQFGWTEEYAKAINNWRTLGGQVDDIAPPKHPRLKHYCTRRYAHLLKLCMVSSIDRHDTLILDKGDFNRALRWLMEAELRMEKIFASGAYSEDSRAMDEIKHFVQAMGTATEAQIVNFARKQVQYSTNIPAMIKVMEQGQMIVHCGNDRMGIKVFQAP